MHTHIMHTYPRVHTYIDRNDVQAIHVVHAYDVIGYLCQLCREFVKFRAKAYISNTKFDVLT